jgi:hypothetical protein
VPKRVSIVVFRECDPSIIYGVFDTLWAAGRFFNVPPGKPFFEPSSAAARSGPLAGEPLFEPRIVAAEHGPLELITGVSISPQDSIDDIEQTDIVFVPNPVVLTPEDLRALDRRIIDWVAKMHEKGATPVPTHRSRGTKRQVFTAGWINTNRDRSCNKRMPPPARLCRRCR